MTLKDIGEYKAKLLNMISDNEDIGELILGEKYDKDNSDEMLYENLFPFLFVQDVQTVTKSYLCIEVDVPRTIDFTFKDMKVIVWCYCHKDIIKYNKRGYKGTRVDILSDMVDRMLNSSNKFGLGRLHLQSATYFSPALKFYGRQLIYNCSEFNIKNKLTGELYEQI